MDVSKKKDLNAWLIKNKCLSGFQQSNSILTQSIELNILF
jgi:hypothetical protein